MAELRPRGVCSVMEGVVRRPRAEEEKVLSERSIFILLIVNAVMRSLSHCLAASPCSSVIYTMKTTNAKVTSSSNQLDSLHVHSHMKRESKL